MKKLNVKNSTIVLFSGIALCLFALIILFSHGTPFEFLTIAICASFGFIGFWILTPFLFILGLYIIFRKRLIKFKLGLSLWGVFVVVLSLMIITSNWGNSEQITFTNSVRLLNEHTPFDPFANPGIGGGFFGYVLAGVLNNAITPIGTSVICWIAFVAGIVMILNKQVVLLFKKIKNARHKRSRKDSYQTVETIGEDDYSIKEIEHHNAPTPESKQTLSQAEIRNLVANNFNSTHGFQRATFHFSDENHVQQPVQKPSFTMASPKVEVHQEVQPVVHNEQVEPILEQNDHHVEPLNSQLSTPNVVENSIKEESVVVQQPEVPEFTDPYHRPQPRKVIRPPFEHPGLDLLKPHESEDDKTKNVASCDARTVLINDIFADLKIGASVVGYTIGPSFTRYDIKMNSNVSSSTMNRYIDDISSRLGGISVRFLPIVIGKTTSGLEIQNEVATPVGLFESLKLMEEKSCKPMDIIFGKNITGDLLTANLTKFPHMLVAGTTGSGKSIFMHSTILTLIMHNSPEDLKIMLIDPKKVEMSFYKDIPHLLCPNINDPKKAYIAFEKLVVEMERRYNLIDAAGCRDIGEFNNYAKGEGIEPLPLICVFIDEYADLSEACKEIREPVVRIAQKARAAGIHLVIATQRPSVNVIDGVIKANIPTHVALTVGSFQDSTVIIGEGGAEKLLGNGDMLVECSLISRGLKPRVQGCFVESSEIKQVCDFLRSKSGPQYDPYFLDLEHSPNEQDKGDNIVSKGDAPEVTKVDKNIQEEELYKVIKEDISSREYCSISFLTRSYGIGFPKAGRLFARLVREGLVASEGDARGSKVLVHNFAPSEQIGSIEQSEFIPNSQLENDEPSNEEDSNEEYNIDTEVNE